MGFWLYSTLEIELAGCKPKNIAQVGFVPAGWIFNLYQNYSFCRMSHQFVRIKSLSLLTFSCNSTDKGHKCEWIKWFQILVCLKKTKAQVPIFCSHFPFSSNLALVLKYSVQPSHFLHIEEGDPPMLQLGILRCEWHSFPSSFDSA